MSGSDWVIEAGASAATLSAVEVGIGSFCHAFHVPLSGHLLSLNQGFLLSRAVIHAKEHGTRHRFLPSTISNVAATLKSLSPAGKKLTPMLAISAQGMLYNLGTLILGANAAGILLGSLLLSLWAFAQPVLFYALLFGKPWLEGLEQLRIGSATIYWIVGALIGIKAICAGALVVLAYRLPESRIAALQAKLAGYRPAPSARKRSQTPARGALADL
ncbi:MAG: hypothetical protein ACXVBW_09600, partial [Bdellovibrionota bacterium]